MPKTARILAFLLTLTFGAVAAPEPPQGVTTLLGSPTDRSVTLSVLSAATVEACVSFGDRSGAETGRTEVLLLQGGTPANVVLTALPTGARTWYRVLTRAPGTADWRPEEERSFMTQRPAGAAFTFDIQGDSHPEHLRTLFDPALYRRTLSHVAQEQPDFHVLMGDDFSLDGLAHDPPITAQRVMDIYLRQRQFLAEVGSRSPIFLVNGNHEQLARYLLDGTATNPAALALRARLATFPLPAPDGFYTGNSEKDPDLGLLHDTFAWTWGDALFVFIDPYWHSDIPVDNALGVRGTQEGRNLWQVTLGDAQYRWLRDTLKGSQARWKFVFCHHVLGTGRGGIEVADRYEWGGRDPRGRSTFKKERPGWDQPIHDLMASTGVDIFFQGHDHIFARQERDGVIYQTVPMPADPNYAAHNRDAFRSGDILPGSGHLRVDVDSDHVQVRYIRSVLPRDTDTQGPDGAVAFSYEIKP